VGIRIDRIRKERDGLKYFDGDLNLRFVNGVYDDSRKVYWNKNSGKWVFKKNKIYVDDFFSWDVYEYINEEIIVGWFAEYGVSGVVEDKYFRYIDRVGYFLDSIIKKSNFDFKKEASDEFDKVYVSGNDLEWMLGREYKGVLRVLEYNGIIKIEKGKAIKYDAFKSINYIVFNKSNFGTRVGQKFIENPILSKAVLKSYSCNPVIGDIELSVIKRLDLDISEESLNRIVNIKLKDKIKEYELKLRWDEIGKKDKLKIEKWLEGDKKGYVEAIRSRYEYYKSALRYIKRGLSLPEWFHVDNHSGRRYNIINSMDKVFRKELKLDGERVVELDMRGSYACSLVYLIERFNRVKANFPNSERRKLYLEYGSKEKFIEMLKFNRVREEVLSKYWYESYEDGLKRDWVRRKEIWKDVYGNGIGYGWGNVNNDDIEDLFIRLGSKDKKYSDKLFIDIFNEYSDLKYIVNKIDGSSGNKLFQGINENYRDFYLSDSYIGEILKGYNYQVECGKWLSNSDLLVTQGNPVVLGNGKNVSKSTSLSIFRGENKEIFVLSNTKMNDVVEYFLRNEEEGIKLISMGFKNYLDNSNKLKCGLLFDIVNNRDSGIDDSSDAYNTKDYEKKVLYNLFGTRIKENWQGKNTIIDVYKREDFKMEIQGGLKREGMKELSMVGNRRFIFSCRRLIKKHLRSIEILDREGDGRWFSIEEFFFMNRRLRPDVVDARHRVEGFIYDLNRLREKYIKEFGIDASYMVSGDFKVDYWERENDFSSFGFLEKISVVYKKGRIGGIDFYDFVRSSLFGFDDKKQKGKYFDERFGDYGRNYWKSKFMRFLLQPNHYNHYLDNFGSYGNLGEKVFGDMVWKFITSIKEMRLVRDEYGDGFKYDDKDSHKIMSKVLCLIEVDVMNYLKNRLIELDYDMVGIFDGLLIKEKDYWRMRFEANSILKNEVGYMFEMK
jgi:hypothetical protein